MMSGEGEELMLVLVGVWFSYVEAGIHPLEWHGG